MRISVLPADLAGCGSYRLMFPAWALQAQGGGAFVDTLGPIIDWDHKWPGADEGAPTPSNAVPAGLHEPYAADVVVCQRPGRAWWPAVIGMLQAQGVRVVVDVDDLFDRTHRAHVGHGAYQGGEADIIDACCRQADLVTATTPPLVDRYGHGHGVLLPNLVPAFYLTMTANKRERTVGWSGVAATHPGDLQATAGALPAVLDRHRWAFHTVGPADGVQKALRLSQEPSATGWVGFDEYAPAVCELEVGIVPLEASPFNHAKSCLKMAEMASLGVPAVVSPTPDNLRLHRAGVGLVAASRGQWARQLGRLCASDAYRQDMAGRGREVMAGLTYEQHCGRWAEAWQSAAQHSTAAA